MSELPSLGREREEGKRWSCGWTDLSVNEPLCHRDATWHGVVLPDPGEQAAPAMSVCDEHLPPMQLLADYVHPFKDPCGTPGSSFRWPENECYIDWDEAAEFAIETAVIVGGE
jgi:hypothetical protein